MSRIPGGYSVRLAIVVKVYKTQVECRYTDREGEHNVRCAIPHPYAGVGGGIFVGIHKGARVLISHAPQEQAYIVAVVPERSYYFDQSGVLDSSVSLTPYPQLAEGEIYLKGPLNSALDIDKNGNISCEVGAGDVGTDLELSRYSQALFIRTNNVYKFTEAGREINGIIKRDKSSYEDPNDEVTVDFLSGETYDRILTNIGRSPKDEISLRSSIISKLTIRNPSLVEKRNITYEFANSFGVRDIETEAKACTLITEGNLSNVSSSIVVDPSTRNNRRTDVLNLSSRNFNHLIEKIEGTVVDIYGNVLDLNRNIIRLPETEELKAENLEESLFRIYSYLRRSIKYHFEINSRKDTRGIFPSLQKTKYNATEHSRWSLDVDGEGLTKINIPASSNTGNIPILGRYITSNDITKNAANSGQFRDPNKQDIKLLQFGDKNGPEIANKEYHPVLATANDGYLTVVGTAHHNILTIASSILSMGGKLRNPNPNSEATVVGPVSTKKIDNTILSLQQTNGKYQTNPNANAGGRSIHANLDGSAEIFIGADSIDRKSLVIDLAGGVISHYGRDRNGRSLIHQTDGDVIIQIGGKGISGDDRFKLSSDTENRPGRIEIHLNRPGKTSQKIIIDENGMTINIEGNVALASTGDFSISAGGMLLLNGTQIHTYGKADNSIDGNRSIIGKERYIIRNGRFV